MTEGASNGDDAGGMSRGLAADTRPGLRAVRVAVTAAYCAAMVAAVIVMADSTGLHTTDQSLARAIATHPAPSWVRVLLQMLELLGQGWFAGPLGTALIAAACWRRRQWRYLIAALAVIVAGAAVTEAAKHLFGRSAPRSGLDQWHTIGLSYPSGHAAQALIVWTLVVGAWFGLTWRAVRSGAFVAAVCATAMVALRYHWLSDALAGLATGAAVLAATTPLWRTACFTNERPARDHHREQPPPR